MSLSHAPGWLPEEHEDVTDGDERRRIAFDAKGAWLAKISWRRNSFGRWSATFILSRQVRPRFGGPSEWRPALVYESLPDEEALELWRRLPSVTPSHHLDDDVALLRVRCLVG